MTGAFVALLQCFHLTGFVIHFEIVDEAMAEGE